MKGTAVNFFDNNWSLSVFCIVHERAYVVSHMDDGHAGFGVLREATARVTRRWCKQAPRSSFFSLEKTGSKVPPHTDASSADSAETARLRRQFDLPAPHPTTVLLEELLLMYRGINQVEGVGGRRSTEK